MSTPYSIDELVALADENMAPISPEGAVARDEYLELSKQIKILEAKRKKYAEVLQTEAETKGASILVDHEITMFELVKCTRSSVDTTEMKKVYPEIVEQFMVEKPYVRIDVKK